MSYVVIIVFSLVSAVLLTLMSCKIMQMLQLSSYRAKGVFAWFKATKCDYILRYFAVTFFSFMCMLVYVACFGKYKYAEYIGYVFYLLNAILFIVMTARQKNKTPLKFTPRIIRLTVLSGLLFCGASFGVLYGGGFTFLRYSLVGLLPLFIPFVTLAAHCLLAPFEKLNNLGYEVKARKKLESMPHLIKIGITGSYGKTTAKNMLTAMLGKKYNVLSTPASYNTPMGIAKTVNYDLNASHEVFVAEMGARYVGDIARLASIVRPNIGIVTAVGDQHLATFGSVEKVYETKYELIKGLSADGLAVFSADNGHTLKMYESTQGNKMLAGGRSDCDVSYGDVSFGAEGTSFTLRYGDESVAVVSKLLGRHIPSLVSVCAATALKLGVGMDDIVLAVGELEPVAHRLQVIKNGDVTVIDDAYNSNTKGAEIALEVLGAFDGMRIVITPGLVELGDAEQNANMEMGRKVFGKADRAYFIGSRAAWLKQGATDAGMLEENVEICADLDEAVRKSSEIGGKKTVLFENDLPDNF